MHPNNRFILLSFLIAAVIAFGGTGTIQAQAANAAAAPVVPRYDHIFLMVFENHAFAQIIGNPAAPNINKLANTFGLATSYFSVADPSEPNYVAMAARLGRSGLATPTSGSRNICQICVAARHDQLLIARSKKEISDRAFLLPEFN